VKLIATILLPVVILLMAESCSRAFITLRDDLKPRAPNVIRGHGEPSRELGWEGFRVSPDELPEPSLPRIVALGDSNTWAYGVARDAAWPEVLGRALPHAEVVNMATLGYSSFQGYQTLRKYGERLKPALLIASFNYCDRGYVYNRDIDSEEKFARFFDLQQRAGTRQWLDKIYTTRVLRAAMSRLGFTRPEPLPKIDVRNLEARVPPDLYRENLRLIAEYGRARDIPVIFIILEDNPYFADMVRIGLAYRERGDNTHAVRAFTIGLTKPSAPLSRKYLAETYARMGMTEKADEVAHMEQQADTIGGFQPIYLDSMYNDLMIEVGRDMGVQVVDARPILDSSPDSFVDMSHPDELAQSKIAQLVLEAIRTVAPELARDAVPIQNSAARKRSSPTPRADPEPQVRMP